MRAARPRRPAEVFELHCWRCNADLELPAASVRGNAATCPHCGARLEIRWEGAH